MIKPILNLLVYFFLPLIVPTILFNVYLEFLAGHFSQINTLFILLLIFFSVLTGAFLSILAYENYVFKSKLLATLIIGIISTGFLFLSLGIDLPLSFSITMTLSYFLAFNVTAIVWNSKLK